MFIRKSYLQLWQTQFKQTWIGMAIWHHLTNYEIHLLCLCSLFRLYCDPCEIQKHDKRTFFKVHDIVVDIFKSIPHNRLRSQLDYLCMFQNESDCGNTLNRKSLKIIWIILPSSRVWYFLTITFKGFTIPSVAISWGVDRNWCDEIKA